MLYSFKFQLCVHFINIEDSVCIIFLVISHKAENSKLICLVKVFNIFIYIRYFFYTYLLVHIKVFSINKYHAHP